MRTIRLRIAGILVRNGEILLVKHRKGNREYFLLPGGGQEPGESMHSALIREWKEELGMDIRAGEFLFMGESVPPHYIRKSQVTQVVFRVSSARGKPAVEAQGALVDFAWVPVERITEIAFFPACMQQLTEYLTKGHTAPYSRYQWLR